MKTRGLTDLFIENPAYHTIICHQDSGEMGLAVRWDGVIDAMILSSLDSSASPLKIKNKNPVWEQIMDSRCIEFETSLQQFQAPVWRLVGA